MADDKLAKIWHKQKSLTEWLEDIGHKDAAAIRREDNDKRERLKVLSEVIGLPFDKPVQFDGIDLADRSPALVKYLNEHGDDLCALRLMPKGDDLPKLRMRGKSVAGAYEWFKDLNLDASKYRADFVPHEEETTWSAIFVVNNLGIHGEIMHGGHHQLTQGLHETDVPRTFNYNFKDWVIQPDDKTALDHLKILAEHLRVSNKSKQNVLVNKLGSNFSKDYLRGYFETTFSDEFGIFFKDYSQNLGKMYDNMVVRPQAKSASLVKGKTGSPGKARGLVHIVDIKNINDNFLDGDILVCRVTTPDFVPLMQKAAAIVTDQGGILSHAAIVARELKVPCIVGTSDATAVLENGQIVNVNADLGIVT